MSSIDQTETLEVTSTFFRPAVGIAFTCATLAALAFTSSELSVAKPVSSAMNMASGKQSNKAGCANFYGSRYEEFPDTKSFQVCADSLINKVSLDRKGLHGDSENHGISYVETGYSTWVSLFSEDDYKGESIILLPLTKTWLWETKMENGQPWNDHVFSVIVEHKATTGIFSVKGNQTPGPSCSILYASNPLWVPYTTGIELCADPDLDKSPTFSYDDIKGQGFTLEDFGGGVSYIVNGKETSSTANSGKHFDGEYSIKIGKGQAKELSSVDMKENKKWGDNVKSIKLTYY